MPTYEYVCTACGYQFTKFQSINDGPVQSCPECVGPVRRIITGGIGVLFKGMGSHATDYRKSQKSDDSCCGQDRPCDNPKRCCGK